MTGHCRRIRALGQYLALLVVLPASTVILSRGGSNAVDVVGDRTMRGVYRRASATVWYQQTIKSLDIWTVDEALGVALSSNGHRLVFDGQQWCLVAQNEEPLACAVQLLGTYTDDQDRPVAKVQATSWTRREKDVTAFDLGGNKDRFSENPLSHRPATCFWVALQSLLAALYWYYKVPSSSVAAISSRMIEQGELWRCWTAATAHLEPWHLLVNMTALLALGEQLEGNIFTSLALFGYILVLIPFISAVWLLLQTIVARCSRLDPHRPTVGFSGVLFAMMVVAALEQEQTCPVFFWPNLCFSTHEFHGWKWSWGPLIQLGVGQVILPGVSFTGHLAGLVMGLVWHWGLLPMQWFQPSISMPLLYWLYLTLWRRLFPVRDRCGQWVPLQARHDMRGRVWVRLMRWYIVMILVSIVVYGPWCPMTASFVLSAVFWYHGCQALLLEQETSALSSDDEGDSGRLLLLTWCRAYIVVATIDSVTAGLTLGSWMLVWSVWSLPDLLVLVLQLGTSMVGMCLSSQLLENEAVGIFRVVFGWTVLRPCLMLADGVFASLATSGESGPGSDLWRPFQGRGQRLGRTLPENDVELGLSANQDGVRLL